MAPSVVRPVSDRNNRFKEVLTVNVVRNAETYHQHLLLLLRESGTYSFKAWATTWIETDIKRLQT